MTSMVQPSKLLRLPPNAGRAIVEASALFVRPLLGTNSFVTFCKDRNVAVDRTRLFCLERLGIFAPIYRVRSPADDNASPFYLPIRKGNDWFDSGLAWDTTAIGPHEIPNEDDHNCEAYYSIFQIDDLSNIVSALTLSVQMDSYLEDSSESAGTQQSGADWIPYFRGQLEHMRLNEYRRSIPLLCQFISERYYPYARGDERTIQITVSTYSDAWLSAYYKDRDWHKYAREWDPRTAETLFELTPEKLRHACETLASAQQHRDPIERWYRLVQFVTIDQRDKLKMDALCAETIRQGANMLRLLHKGLYKTELAHPNETTGTIITHFPELSVRRDVRRHLEFVVNQFGLNPQPRLTILVEGQSEERGITKLFEEYFGYHPGKLGIEIVILWGVDTATGAKEDNYRAIIRLIDYLHHHQTITFLILDNENYAGKLKTSARKAKSIHHRKRFATRPEYIRIWKQSFEFDNFSCTEIAAALNEFANGHASFSREEIDACKNSASSGDPLSKLYKQKTGYGLNKINLSEILVNNALVKTSRKMRNRPVVKVLERIERLAALNHLPIRAEIWERNQASKFMGKKRS
jgi:hypothetical protein